MKRRRSESLESWLHKKQKDNIEMTLRKEENDERTKLKELVAGIEELEDPWEDVVARDEHGRLVCVLGDEVAQRFTKMPAQQ